MTQSKATTKRRLLTKPDETGKGYEINLLMNLNNRILSEFKNTYFEEVYKSLKSKFKLEELEFFKRTQST